MASKLRASHRFRPLPMSEHGAPHPYRPELDMLTVYDLFVKHIVQPLPNALQQIKTTLTVSFPPALNLPPLTKN